MKRLLFSAAVLAFVWNAPGYAQEGTERALDRIGNELGRLNRTLDYGPLGRGGGGLGSDFANNGIMIDGLVYHPYYFSERGTRERKQFQNRLDRAKAKRAKQSARKVK